MLQIDNNDYYVGDWGLGIGDWGLGNPQSPIPNPLMTLYKNIFISKRI